MRYSDTLIDEYTDDMEEGRYRFAVETVFDDEAASLDFFVRVVQPDDQPLCILTLRATTTNPLDVTAVVLFAGGVYGVCVSGGIIGAVGKVAFQSYEASKKESPDASRPERMHATWMGVKTRKAELKAEAVKALLGCLTKFFGP